MNSKWLAIVVFIIPGPVFSADGTITISGAIEGSTCTITGGAGPAPGSAADFAVTLDKVQASSLAAEGQTAAGKPFFIHIGGTACAASSVAVLFEPGSPSINPSTGNLRNTAPTSAATNVEVQIVDASTNRPIDLRLGTSSTALPVPTGSTVTLPFLAQYVATGGTAGSGAFQTSVLYSVTFP
ncbi:fimbrial protein [Pseudomonas syringae]|uniref:fimbrial protein n=1 Tax=Pseudomonas syringae TaxID=317 RepID=UPI000F02B155|nr:fimbrial protein [Pseudomonas syringae]MCF5722562.1 type 1 fimbrial protein [Pseudomonas syringae]